MEGEIAGISRAHDLKPKQAGALDTPEGPRASARHRGQKGTHAVSRAAHEVEQTLNVLGAEHLTQWAKRVERNAKKHSYIS